MYVELQPRQSLVPSLASVSICHPLPFNFFRIRTEHPARDANPACPEHLGERASRVAPFASRMLLRAEGSSFPSNPLRIRTSRTSLPQPVYNPHLRRPLGCVGSKGLTGTRIHRQLFCNQHLRAPLGSVKNTGLIIPLESALTKNAPATLLESALTKSRGEGTAELRGFFFRVRHEFFVRAFEVFDSSAGEMPDARRHFVNHVVVVRHQQHCAFEFL